MLGLYTKNPYNKDTLHISQNASVTISTVEHCLELQKCTNSLQFPR